MNHFEIKKKSEQHKPSERPEADQKVPSGSHPLPKDAVTKESGTAVADGAPKQVLQQSSTAANKTISNVN